MRVIPNGFVFDQFDPVGVNKSMVRNELGIDSSVPIIGCVGRFHADKGQDVLFRLPR